MSMPLPPPLAEQTRSPTGRPIRRDAVPPPVGAFGQAGLIRRIQEFGMEVPVGATPEQLRSIVERAERQQAQVPHASPPSPSSPSQPPKGKASVGELKSRLRELGFEIPTNIVEKSELVALVEEAERHASAASASHSKPQRPDVPALKVELPEPWIRQESRSRPGRFYFVNRETSERTWEPWFQQESRSIPGRFYFINVLTGESTWEPPTRRWKEKAHLKCQEEASLTLEPPSEAEPELEPPQPPSFDYRDEAFNDGNRIHDDSDHALSDRRKARERQPSVTSVLACERDTQGVKSLSTAAPVDDWEQSLSLAHGAMPQVLPGPLKGHQVQWIKGPLIGRGSLGRVFKACQPETGRIIAVKEVPINSHDKRDAEFRESLENEVNIMKALEHKHIVSYLGHDYLDACLYLYLEHMPGGTITQALHEFGPFAESLIASYSKQVLEGLEYLHTRDPAVIHRDIKGSNILIGDGSNVKLADFGCSKRTDDTLTHTMRGSIPWMAPEVLAHSRYGRAADLWSFGCVVIEMGTANVPWGKFEHHMAALVKIGLSQETPPLPEDVSDTCQDFISRCVKRDPDERYNATDMLQHEFVIYADVDQVE